MVKTKSFEILVLNRDMCLCFLHVSVFYFFLFGLFLLDLFQFKDHIYFFNNNYSTQTETNLQYDVSKCNKKYIQYYTMYNLLR